MSAFLARESAVLSRLILSNSCGHALSLRVIPRCHLQRRQAYSSTASSNILSLHERGIFSDVFPSHSDGLQKLLTSSPQCIYCGVDPTADSLHIGNLLALVALLHCQRGGHNCIALIGGATALIGDPSGKAQEREALQSSTVEGNAASIHQSLQRVFTNHERFLWRQQKTLPEIRILNNRDWYQDKNVVQFLGSFGRFFRMGTMLSRHSVQTRLASPEGMNFSEFTYQVFQAYDFFHLHQQYKCNIQVGGTDQLGNIMSGHDVIKKVTGKDVYGLTIPLVTSSSGDKLGKSAGNAIWINSNKTSEFDLYQYFIRLADADVERYLKLFTFLSLPEIAQLMKAHQAKPEKRMAQRKLAEQVLLLVHGEEGLLRAQRQTDALYSSEPGTLDQLSEEELMQLFQGAGLVEMMLEPGLTVYQVGVAAGAIPEGRGVRIIEEGGFYVNHERITNPREVLQRGIHILGNNITLIRIGKRNYTLVRWV
ncbi:tyrosine--tRNA ligase, mitochondrial-like [Diadema antillarum]|uniref:tyrosine--tRNA ligase, mitochondrial-like n=1 Tax=Diadema antillarum TaxID=105358 RepID=UPI003A86434D